ncbi:MAG TPA: hypothetical protein VFK08_00955 [Rhodanobacteraceae bacterium]|nr:hypothetical protein [Rhodanobacteraceae bacterium]
MHDIEAHGGEAVCVVADVGERKQVRDIYVGGAGKLMTTLNKNFPTVMDWVGEKMMTTMQMRDEPAHPRADSLADAGSDGQVEGDYPDRHPRHSLYTSGSRHPLMAGVVIAAAMLRGGQRHL